jgi:hypothetical protein
MGRKKEEIQGGLPIQDLEDYARNSSSPYSPPHEGTVVIRIRPGLLTSGSPKHPRLPAAEGGSDIAADVVPSYSGGTVRELHPLPVDRTILSGRTVDDQ